MKTEARLGIFLSGGGTTLQNLIDRGIGPIACVVSSKTDAYGLKRAQHAGITTHVVERRAYADRDTFSEACFALCRQAEVDLVCLAGFLQLLRIPPDYQGRVLNVHPSLLPAFGGKGFHGLHVHRAVLEEGVKLTGCTVHFADDQYDRGPIVVQKAVPVREDDTPETLQARVFVAECEAFPEAIALFAAGRLHVEGRRVKIGSGS